MQVKHASFFVKKSFSQYISYCFADRAHYIIHSFSDLIYALGKQTTTILLSYTIFCQCKMPVMRLTLTP